MKDTRSLWAEEQIEDVYKLLVKFCGFSFFLSTVLKAVSSLFSPKEFFLTVAIPQTLMHMIVYYIIKLTQDKPTILKVMVSFFVAEYFNAFLLYHSKIDQMPQAGIFELTATLVCFFFEFFIIKNKWVLNFLVLKQLYLWHFHGVIFGDNGPAGLVEFIPYASIWLIMGLVNVGYHHLTKISYEHFVYMKGKKMSNLSESNNLIEDICYLIEHPQGQDVTLGISLSGNVNLEWKATLIEWEKKLALFVLIRDASQIIELERNLANDKMKTLLLRTVSHELRTPMNSIIHFTDDILGSQEHLESEARHKLKIISVSAKMMISMINDLLDYSKIIAGFFALHKSYCNIREIIENALDLIQTQASKKNLSVCYRIDPELPELVFTDPLRFSQIILNLLNNSLKFTITGKIEICLIKSSENRLKCYVEDTGIGMNDTVIQMLTTNFKSFDIPHLNCPGCSLGMCISNLLVKQLGGESFQFKSILGKGTAVWFLIDLLDHPSRSERYESIQSEISGSHFEWCHPSALYIKHPSPSVLIVDDMEFDLEILASIMKKHGISYAEAQNGETAIDLVKSSDSRKQPFKVILMDCEMPGISGWDATRKINKLFMEGEIESLPYIIGYSAYSSDEDIKKGINCGMTDFLTKPSTPEKIMFTILRYLS
ncbi:unnamed protein product [Blepharisma stoltei]|uniref:Histidine kinase n=1 Tax=Blepharisma stoltei TaxID=1481888 RepID=A0AAU9JCP5_9CILI|nr:unnamed protein product [Blepharisma stoltei]